MVENQLTDALREYIEAAVKDLRLPVKNGTCGEERVPQVLDFDLPPKRSGEKDDFPFVIVRADSGEIEAEQSEIDVYIIVGCYSDDFTANRDCLNVMSRIRNALTMLPNGILADKYELQYPLKWTLHGEQPNPQSQLDMLVKFAYMTPMPQFDAGGF